MRGRFRDATVEAPGPGREVITIDCRSHGYSDKPEGPYTVELFTDDAAAANGLFHSSFVA